MGLYITVGAEFPEPGKPAPGDAQRLPPAPEPHHSHSAIPGTSPSSCCLVSLLKSHLELCDTSRPLLCSLLNQSSALPWDGLSWDQQLSDQNTNHAAGGFAVKLHLPHGTVCHGTAVSLGNVGMLFGPCAEATTLISTVLLYQGMCGTGAVGTGR